MPQFKIGDKVRRNDVSDDDEDGNLVKLGDFGEITAYYNDGDNYDFCVRFHNKGCWWIKAKCVEHLEPQTKQTIEQQVIAKIKYLNEKYAKSRTVPTQVVDAKQGELGASTTSIGREAPRITPTSIRIPNPYWVDGNSIRSETTRLRGIDASVELYGYRVASILVDELRAE